MHAVVTSGFALLNKSLQWNRKIQCGNSFRRMLTLFELFGVGTLFPHSVIALRPWASSNYTCTVLFLAFVSYQQNHCWKVLNREALHLCRGSYRFKYWQQIHWFIVFHSSIWGAWKFVWWGRSPPIPLWRRNWLSTDIYFKKYITKPCQIHHQIESNTFSKLFLLKWHFLWLQMFVYLWTKGATTKLALATGWLWFTVLAVQTYKLSSKLATQTHQVHYLL